MNRKELQNLSVEELVDLVLDFQKRNEEFQTQQDMPSTPHDGQTKGDAIRPFPVEEDWPLERDVASANLPLPEQQSLDDELRRTSLLLQLSIEFRETLEPTVIVERMLHVMVNNLGVTNASVVLVGLDGSVELAMTLRDGEVQQVTAMITRAVLDRGLAGWVLRHGRSVVLPDVARDKRWIPYAEWQKTGSAIVLPIRQAQTSLGVLTIYHPTPNYFASRDLLLMEGVAAQAGVAFGAARRYIEESRRREQALALFSMSQFLTAERTYDDLATMLQEKSVSIFGVDYGLLFLTREDMSLLPISIPQPLQQSSAKALLAHATFSAQSAWERKSIVTDVDPPDRPTRTFMALPLVHSGNAIGAVVLMRTSGNEVTFSASIWSMLTTFTNVIAATCANMKLLSQLKRYTESLETLVAERTQLLQRSRDFLRVVFDNLTEGLVLLDAQEIILAANNAFCYSIVGRHPRTIVGLNLPSVWEELEQRGELHIEVLSSSRFTTTPGDRNRTMRVYCVNSIGQKRWFEVGRIAVTGDDDELEHYVERWSDITHQEELHRRVLLQDQRNILGHLTAKVVHDIDEPLHEVVDSLNLCTADENLSPQVQDYLKQAHEGLDRINRTLSSLSYLYQTPKTNWECVQINQLLREVEQSTAQKFHEQGVSLWLHLDEQVMPIYGQPDALRQVFLGIAFNAQEAMPTGGDITITTQWKEKSEEVRHPYCQINIRDTGVGMTADQIANLFEPFRSRKAHGIGLGMYLNKQIIEQHAGRIEVFSKKPEGTIVEIYLPWNERCSES